MKAYTYIIDSFDASNDYVIRYYYDGDQPYGSICIIKENNEQENEVYNATQFTMHMEHTIPKNTLTNISLPSWSVPNQCSLEGLEFAILKSFKSYV